MTLWSYLKVLRKRWFTVVVCTLLGALAAVLLTLPMQRTYSASARSFVSITSTGSDTNSVYQNGQFAMQRIESYTFLVDSPQVLVPVIHQLHLSATLRELRDQVTATNPVNTVLLNVRVTGTDPERTAAIANAVSAQLDKVIEKLETPRSGSASPVKVVLAVPATVPQSPVSPRVRLNIVLGLLVGLAIGVTVAVLRDQIDTTVKTEGDIEGLTGMTPLAMIAADAQTSKRPPIALTNRTAGVEAFRTLRTNLKFVNVDHPPREVVVTSAVAKEGKTTVAYNLAIAFAQSGLGVCLVEADLRRPKVTEYLGIEGAVGLTDVVAGAHKLDDVLVPWNHGMLTVLPAGTTPSDPSQLLGSNMMETLLGELRSRFDIVILDAPPLLPVSDAAVLARVTDGALLVSRHGRTKRDQLAKAVESLTAVNAHIIGSVLNFVPPKEHLDGYGYSNESVNKKPSKRHESRRDKNRHTGKAETASAATKS